MRPLLLLAAAALALAGCAGPDAAAGRAFSGAFTEAATQDEMAAFGDAMRARGADDVLLMESFPVQFRVLGLAQGECDDARAHAATLPFVASVGACDAP